MTKTSVLERRIRNEECRFRRLKSSRDIARLQRMRDRVLPELRSEIDVHNSLIRCIALAKAQASLLLAYIDRPSLCFRRSYSYEFFIEDLLIEQAYMECLHELYKYANLVCSRLSIW